MNKKNSRKLIVKAFLSVQGHKDLVLFVNENDIDQEAIVSITHYNNQFTLFYYSAFDSVKNINQY